jgi:hypothetical protein
VDAALSFAGFRFKCEAELTHMISVFLTPSRQVKTTPHHILSNSLFTHGPTVELCIFTRVESVRYYENKIVAVHATQAHAQTEVIFPVVQQPNWA